MAQKQVAKKIKIKCKWCTVRDLLRPLTVDGALKENTNYNRVGWFKSKQKKKTNKSYISKHGRIVPPKGKTLLK
jgi:hypothetical protein